ncbi:MAG: O-antigen ligase family protein [Rhodobiaceae bacterium]|nr:O-antigen ligase family protein [Rhodobiaceae bacterium]
MASLIATRTLNSAPPTGVGQRILFLVSGFSVKTAYYCLAFFLTLSALVLTGSRGGVLATLMGLFVLAWHMRVRSKKRKNTVLLPMVGVLAIMLVVFSFSGGYLNDRLDRGADLNRLNVYQVTVEAIQDHAWIGSGLGSFRQIFPLYRDEDNLSSSVWHRAHNTYLENTLELGIPASLLLHLAMAYLVWMCWRGVNTRSRDMHFSAVGLAASVLVALHSLVDFSLQIPAITIAYMFLMGIAVSQSISTRRV